MLNYTLPWTFLKEIISHSENNVTSRNFSRSFSIQATQLGLQKFYGFLLFMIPIISVILLVIEMIFNTKVLKYLRNSIINQKQFINMKQFSISSDNVSHFDQENQSDQDVTLHTRNQKDIDTHVDTLNDALDYDHETIKIEKSYRKDKSLTITGTSIRNAFTQELHLSSMLLCLSICSLLHHLIKFSHFYLFLNYKENFKDFKLYGLITYLLEMIVFSADTFICYHYNNSFQKTFNKIFMSKKYTCVCRCNL